MFGIEKSFRNTGISSVFIFLNGALIVTKESAQRNVIFGTRLNPVFVYFNTSLFSTYFFFTSKLRNEHSSLVNVWFSAVSLFELKFRSFWTSINTHSTVYSLLIACTFFDVNHSAFFALIYTMLFFALVFFFIINKAFSELMLNMSG